MTYTQARKARPAFLAELALIDAEYGTEIPGRKAGRKTPEEHWTLLGRRSDRRYARRSRSSARSSDGPNEVPADLGDGESEGHDL